MKTEIRDAGRVISLACKCCIFRSVVCVLFGFTATSTVGKSVGRKKDEEGMLHTVPPRAVFESECIGVIFQKNSLGRLANAFGRMNISLSD
jgi:hypothetical protein